MYSGRNSIYSYRNVYIHQIRTKIYDIIINDGDFQHESNYKRMMSRNFAVSTHRLQTIFFSFRA